MLKAKWIKQYDGWLLLILIMAIVCCVSAVFIKMNGFQEFWQLWNIKPLLPRFFDMQNLAAGYDSIKMGYDPLYNNHYDPAGRPMNHPRIVQHIVVWLGYGRGHISILGYSAITFFFIGVLLSFLRIDKKTAVIVALALFSPAVMLGIERGNHDLFVFFLVSLALFFSRSAILSIPVLLSAAFIKLFPIFASVYLLRFNKTKFLISFFICMSIFIVYLIFNYTDLLQVMSSTQIGGSLSYGAKVIITFIGAHYKDRAVFAYIPVVAILITTIAFFFHSGIYRKCFDVDRSFIDHFRVSAGIYVGTFMLGNMWDYRLMFLLFAIPQLVKWISLGQFRFISILALTSLLLTCWMTYFDPRIHIFFAIDELSNYILWSTFIYLGLASLPVWLYELFDSDKKQSIS